MAKELVSFFYFFFIVTSYYENKFNNFNLVDDESGCDVTNGGGLCGGPCQNHHRPSRQDQDLLSSRFHFHFIISKATKKINYFK